jgi:hypothetical protein
MKARYPPLQQGKSVRALDAFASIQQYRFIVHIVCPFLILEIYGAQAIHPPRKRVVLSGKAKGFDV